MAHQEQPMHCIAWKKCTLKLGWNIIPERCSGVTKNGRAFCGRHANCGQDLLEIPFEKRVEMITVTCRQMYLLSVEKQQALRAIDYVLSHHILEQNQQGAPPQPPRQQNGKGRQAPPRPYRPPMQGGGGNRQPDAPAPPPPPPPPPPPVLPEPLVEGEEHPCGICYDQTTDVFCTNRRHALCSGCFEGHVESECDRPEFDGSITCPFSRMNECDCSGFSQRFILGHLHDDAFKEYERKRDAQKERELVIKLEAEIEERVRKEMANSHGIEKHRQHIIENILTLRCPSKRCRAAYFEFDGCLSVMCSKCRTHFCAVCHKDCKTSQEGHRHVLTHTAGQTYYGTNAQIKQYQNAWRMEEVKKFLKKEPKEEAARVMLSMEREFRDLGMIA